MKNKFWLIHIYTSNIHNNCVIHKKIVINDFLNYIIDKPFSCRLTLSMHGYAWWTQIVVIAPEPVSYPPCIRPHSADKQAFKLKRPIDPTLPQRRENVPGVRPALRQCRTCWLVFSADTDPPAAGPATLLSARLLDGCRDSISVWVPLPRNTLVAMKHPCKKWNEKVIKI